MNGVSFRAAMDSSRDLLNAPQTFSRPQSAAMPAQPMVPPKKKSGIGKKILGLVAGVAIAAGALAAGKHYQVFDKLVSWGAKGDASNVLGKMQNYAGKAGEYLNQGGAKLIEWGTTAWNAAKGLIGKGEAAA